MTHLLPLTVLALALGSAQDPGASSDEKIDVRVFLIDKSRPERLYKNAAASLTIVNPSGKSTTVLLPVVPKGAAPAADEVGSIRGLVGTPYFVELHAGGLLRESDPAPAAEPDPKKPTARDILNRVHQGTPFVGRIDKSLVAEPFTATVTIRLENLAFTSEEFDAKPCPETTPDAAAQVACALELLKAKSEENAPFMVLRPLALDLLRSLARLAPAGFEDLSGDLERHRQWCLAMARRIEDACAGGQAAKIPELCLQSGPRLREMQSALSKEKAPPSETPDVK